MAEAGDDRQVGGAAAEPDRADARLVAALLVAHRPAALDEDRADPVERALGQLQLAGEVAEREVPFGTTSSITLSAAWTPGERPAGRCARRRAARRLAR